MKIGISLFSVFIILLVFGAWFDFLKGKELPPSEEIESILIIYNEAIGDLLPDDHETKEFEITDRNKILTIRNIIGALPVSRAPIMNSDIMDDGQNWIVNIYFTNGDFRFILVDKNQVLGKISKSSKLYEYLRNNYT